MFQTTNQTMLVTTICDPCAGFNSSKGVVSPAWTGFNGWHGESWACHRLQLTINMLCTRFQSHCTQLVCSNPVVNKQVV